MVILVSAVALSSSWQSRLNEEQNECTPTSERSNPLQKTRVQSAGWFQSRVLFFKLAKQCFPLPTNQP